MFLSAFALAGALSAQSVPSASTPASDEARLRAAVSGLGEARGPRDFELLDAHRCAALPLLAAELRPVPEGRIAHDELPSRPAAMHVVWTIMALRYLTGEEMTARTSAPLPKTGGVPGDAWDLLRKGLPRGETQFFAVWMSRDHVYLADVAAQRRIIEKWRALATGPCRPPAGDWRKDQMFWISGVAPD